MTHYRRPLRVLIWQKGLGYRVSILLHRLPSRRRWGSELRENCISSLPISNYGAAKLSSKVLAAAHESGFASINIFRFANVVGNIATHGVIYDFVKRLISNDEELVVLGNGAQAKRYIHVNDLVNAMQFIDKSINHGSLQCFNIALKGNPTTVQQIAEFVVSQLNQKPRSFMVQDLKVGWVIYR